MLPTTSELQVAEKQIRAVLQAHAEWFCAAGGESTFALRREEINVNILQNRLLLSCFTEDGSRSWRVLNWHWNEPVLSFLASSRMGARRSLIELIPRASARVIAATIKAARQIRCEQMAGLASALEPMSRIERVALSPGIRRGQPGPYGRILLRRKQDRIAVTGSVAHSHPAAVDAFLSSALLWYERTADRLRPPYITQLWLLVSEESFNSLDQRLALLRESLRALIKVFTVDDALTNLESKDCAQRKDLWKKRLARFPPVPPATISLQMQQIIAEAPEAIDVVHARHGETLRYFGLPFARVRSIMNVERVWFGIRSGHRRLLDEHTFNDWQNLMRDLREHRSPIAPDQRHAFYRDAAEAWLESLLRHDITKLDPGLIIAPLHAQFRTARGGKPGVRPIDMLALRRDGRLVVIELKVSEDREHVVQGADYWRRVEAHRRRGHIAAAKLFGEQDIRNESPLVYLVAPTLRVHASFQTLARCIAADIEIYRFDINEDWRAGVRVMRRMRVN
ncbi:MAG: hypothetical protein ABR555_05005 [Pyrinomonadaceae bacterium]